MSTWTKQRVLGAVPLALVIVGCTAGSQLAVERASREYDCPESKLEATWLSSGPNNYEIYKVEG
jgi:hypothetical protein